VPEEAFRRNAVLAFRYSAPPFALTLPVVTQKEAAVFTTIAAAALVEQVLGTDATLNGRVCYSILTSRGDRLAIRLPEGARLYAVTVDGVEAPVEATAQPDTRLVRLNPSAGQTSRFLLEISYGQDHADAGHLGVPSLGEDTPVQQTLWRVWLPSEQLLLGHGRDFAPLDGQATSYAGNLGLSFTMPPQGRGLDFIRQGPPGELGLLTVRNEVFTVVVWAVVLAGGAAMLLLGPWRRLLVLLAVAVVLAVVNLAAPLLVEQLVRRGWMAGAIVLVLWLGHALLRGRRGPTRPAASPPGPPTATAAVGADKE
jgi:hypothetical protein